MTRERHRDCPVCFEKIRAQALLCRFCGAVLTEQPLPTVIPAELARAVEAEIERSTAQGKARKGKQDRPALRGRSASAERDLTVDSIEDVIASRYEGIDPAFAIKHRQRLEEFLASSAEEYRTASVLFVDIGGYTALSERLSTGAVKEMLDSFYEVCAQAVGRYNGFVVKYEGDACLAVFGAPVAYDRDVEGALHAALEIREVVGLFPPMQGTELTVSIGLATGKILSSATVKHGRRDFDVFGQAVNLAARLQSAAGKNIILVCPSTYELSCNVFDFRRLRPRRFKNIAQPVTTYEAIGALRPESIERRDFSAPFVGRQREMKALVNAWETFRKRDGHFPTAEGVVVNGMPGIGKTRLLTEFVTSVGDGAKALRGQCNPHDAKAPYSLWRSVLTQLWQGNRDENAELSEANLIQYLQDSGTAGKRLAKASGNLIGLRAMFGAPSALAQAKTWGHGILRRQIQADLGSLLELVGLQSPVILILDDLQWADKSSLDLLEGLATPPCPQGLFFLLVRRSGFKIPGARLGKLPQIALQALEDKSRDELFGHLASVHEIMPEIRECLLAQSSGNPLFLVELVRTVMGRLAQEKKTLKGKELSESIREWVPGSLKQLLESRIDLLDRRHRRVLQCGAVLGHQFAYRLIELFDTIRDGLLARLYSLKGLEFLNDVRSARDLEFLFRHHLTRETAYQSLLERQRRELHGLIAERMENAFSSRITDLYPLLAHHYDLAQEREKSLKYLHLAGDRAASLGAAPEAINFYQTALQKLLDGSPRPEEELRIGIILRSKGRLHRLLGQCDLALAAFEQALQLSAVQRDQLLVADLIREGADTYLYLSDYAKARKALDRVAPMARALKAVALQGDIENDRFYCAYGEGDHRTAAKHASKALQLAEITKQPGKQADAHNNLALLEWKAGRLPRALEQFQHSLRIRRSTGNRFGMAITLMNIGIIHENLGAHSPAKRHYERALAMAEQLRFVQVQSATLANLGNLCLVRNAYNEAIDYSARSLQLAQVIGDLRSEAIAFENLALGQIGLAQYEEASKVLREGRRIARRINDKERLFSLDLVEIESLLAQPNIGTKRAPQSAINAKLATASVALKKEGYTSERPRLMRLQIKAHILEGKPRKARAVFDQALRECDRQKNLSERKRIFAMKSEIAPRR